MFGFLLKVGIIAAVVVGVFTLVSWRRTGQVRLPSARNLTLWVASSFNREALSKIKNVNMGSVSRNLSSALDSLVTHPDRNSPVVLGVKITNDSLNTVVDVIQNLPPDQVNQIKALLCTPATSSGR